MLREDVLDPGLAAKVWHEVRPLFKDDLTLAVTHSHWICAQAPVNWPDWSLAVRVDAETGDPIATWTRDGEVGEFYGG